MQREILSFSILRFVYQKSLKQTVKHFKFYFATMKRRDFLTKAGLATGGLLTAPYILPSGRLFAKTASRKVNHVVYCLFAGGLRQLESVQKMEGNLMPNMLRGTEAISSDLLGSMSAMLPPIGKSLDQQGVLFKEFRFAKGPTGHFNAHSTAICGQYSDADVDIRRRNATPTIFEYYNKHNSPSTTKLKSWWVSNSLGPYPNLNFSTHPEYGALYGGNYIQPYTIMEEAIYKAIGNPKKFSDDDKGRIARLRAFCDNNFAGEYKGIPSGIVNTASDSILVEQFLAKMYLEALDGKLNNPWGIPSYMNGDMHNVYFAERIMQEFQPELLVVNMSFIDVCHQNYSGYCNYLRFADYAVGHLWQTIQSTPGMANDTLLIIAPEHGRNLNPNTIADENGRLGIDHSNDEMSRRIFCMALGPTGVVKQNVVFNEERGESIDIVPTIAHALGFGDAIPKGMLQGRVLEEIFV